MNETKYTQKELEIRNYCKDRWRYYEEVDNGYYPSKHDSMVLSDAAKEYGISVEEAETIFNKVDRIIVNEQVSKMNTAQMVALFEHGLRRNKESPWGMALNSKKE